MDYQQGTIGRLMADTEIMAVDLPLVWSKDEDIGFKIECVCSYRGYYDQSAMVVSLVQIEIADNVGYLRKMLNKLTSETFCGWKGGDYRYNLSNDIYLVDDCGMTTSRNKTRTMKVKSNGTFNDKRIDD